MIYTITSQHDTVGVQVRDTEGVGLVWWKDFYKARKRVQCNKRQCDCSVRVIDENGKLCRIFHHSREGVVALYPINEDA